jgi:hypothetical protein
VNSVNDPFARHFPVVCAQSEGGSEFRMTPVKGGFESSESESEPLPQRVTIRILDSNHWRSNNDGFGRRVVIEDVPHQASSENSIWGDKLQRQR